MGTHDYFDDIDWAAMDTPPVFHSILYETIKRDGTETTETTLVITSGEDFPEVAGAWPAASPETRAAHFWGLGRLHYTEVELMRLPVAKGRTEALSVAGVVGPSKESPAVLARTVQRAVHAARERHDVDPPQMKADEPAVYLKLVALRACKPYSGPGPDTVNVVILRQAHFWRAKEALLYEAKTAT